MRTFVYFLLILALCVWAGGIIFFSFVVAPTVFATLRSQDAASVVNLSLATLHRIGLSCGVLFLALTFLVELKRAKPLRALVALMVLSTAVSQFGVTPQMQRIRDAVGGSIQALPSQDAGRAAFSRLHQLSVVLEGVTLFAGIGALALLSREPQS